MGVRDASEEQTARRLAEAGRRAVVGPAGNGWCFFAEEASDSRDPAVVDRLAGEASRALGTALAVLDHDDDLLWIRLFRDGRPTGAIDTDPGYFDGVDEEPAVAGAAAFAAHDALAKLLRPPAYSVGFGDRCAMQGETLRPREDYLWPDG